MRWLAILACLTPVAAQAVDLGGTVVAASANGGITFVRIVPRDDPNWQELGMARDGRPLLPASLNAASVQVDPRGHFQLKDVAAGAYYLTAERVTGFPPEGDAIQLGSLHTDAVGLHPLDVTDRDLTGLEIAMAPPRDLRVTFSTAPGSVCPLKGGIDTVTHVLLRAIVALSSSAADVWAEERFTIPKVAPVPTRMLIYPQFHCYVQSIRYAGKDAVDSVVDLSQDGLLEVTLANGGGLKATVMDDVNPAIPVQAAITFVMEGGKPWTRQMQTVLRGAFDVWDLPPGTYRILAWTGLPPSQETVRAKGTLVTVEKGKQTNTALTVLRLAEESK